jgi:hypothetical protein
MELIDIDPKELEMIKSQAATDGEKLWVYRPSNPSKYMCYIFRTLTHGLYTLIVRKVESRVRAAAQQGKDLNVEMEIRKEVFQACVVWPKQTALADIPQGDIETIQELIMLRSGWVDVQAALANTTEL